MSHSSSVFNRVPIDLPNRSGFNLDHENQFSATCGTLIPAYAKPVLPKDTISMGVNFQCQLPPMVSDFAGKIDAVFEAFFVPNRILWGGWEDFITHPSQRPIYPTGTPVQNRPSRKPVVYLSSSNGELDVDAASLADYLGWKKEDYTIGLNAGVDALPFLAYHMIYEHWYRDSRVQSPLFFPPAAADQNSQRRPACAPYVSIASTTNTAGPSYDFSNSTFGDGSNISQLRQRNWSKGYFTTASPLPQAGEAAEVTFDVANDEGAISIASLRSANSIQQWMERNNFSYTYADQIYAQYGIYPESAKMDKPIFLGRTKQTVYTRSVMQTVPGSYGSTTGTKVPGWTQHLGSKGGSSQAIGEGRLFENFTPSEHGFLFVIFSLVPHAYYGTGCARHLIELESEDIPFPLLAGMGDQPIYKWELTGSNPSESGDIFGYTDRYAHYKYDEDEVHGLLRDGETLSSLALQRGFSGEDLDVELSSEFLQIPMNALDQVQAVGTSTLGYSCIVNSFFKLTKISTLPAYSLPTLGDLKNTHKGSVSRGGSRL